MHIIGAGGHAKVVLDIILSREMSVYGFWDENSQPDSFLNHRILGNLSDFKNVKSNQYIIAIGSNQIRRKVSIQLEETVSIAVHSSSVVSGNTEIGGGTVLMPNTTVNSGTVIGNHVIINTNASIDHDCAIGDFVHISPNVGMAGGVTVGEGSHLGIGSTVIQNIKIGKWATIGAGAVIIANVPDYAVVVGNPGKIIKYNKYEY